MIDDPDRRVDEGTRDRIDEVLDESKKSHAESSAAKKAALEMTDGARHAVRQLWKAFVVLLLTNVATLVLATVLNGDRIDQINDSRRENTATACMREIDANVRNVEFVRRRRGDEAAREALRTYPYPRAKGSTTLDSAAAKAACDRRAKSQIPSG